MYFSEKEDSVYWKKKINNNNKKEKTNQHTQSAHISTPKMAKAAFNFFSLFDVWSVCIMWPYAAKIP